MKYASEKDVIGYLKRLKKELILQMPTGSGGSGSGDMLKSVYDVNNNGIVDNAEKLDGKHASEFASSSHQHPGTDITSKVADSDKLDGKHASEFASASHKTQHAIGGADAITPSDIGAVNKAGDTMTGTLTVPGLNISPISNGQFLKKQNDQIIGVEIVSATGEIQVGSIISTNIRHSANNTQTITTTTFTMVKEFQMNEIVGKLRLYLTGKSYKTGVLLIVQIRKNGSTFLGNFNFGNIEVTNYLDITAGFSAGDKLQVWAAMESDGIIGYVKNCQLAYDFGIVKIGSYDLASPIALTKKTYDITITLN